MLVALPSALAFGVTVYAAFGSDHLAERGGLLLRSQLPRKLPNGQNMQRYFDQAGLVRPEVAINLFDELEAHMQQRHYQAGERIFANGDSSDELYMIRRGAHPAALRRRTATPPGHLRTRRVLR